MKKRFTEAQIVGFLREADAGIPVKELCLKHGFSDASYYLWRSKFGGMSVSDAKRLKELEIENTRLRKLLADALLENEVTGEVVREMVTRGLSERHGLRPHVRDGAGYVPRPDPDPSLRDRIVALAHRHRRYGAGMIYVKLRQEGRRVDHKRVD